ncbi:MAG: DNRLRE domain-containing protein, partial [Planctomycetota bacterium]|nr:DNRLRE domain-containing protein [Planctomycetota bacterium]
GGGTGGGTGGGGLPSGTTIRRALVQFDLAGALPPGAVITAASLELFVEQTSASQPTTAFAHRVIAPWSEGSVVAAGSGGGGGPVAPGESTWLHRDYPNVFWANPGGDFAATPSFSMSLPLTGPTASAPAPGLIADIQSWLANPANNHGWLLKTDELQLTTARRCWSREASANGPKLTITYLTPGEVASYGQPCPVRNSTSDFQLTLTSGPVAAGSSVGLTYSSGPANLIGASIFSLGHDPVGIQLFTGCSTYLTTPLIPGNCFVIDGAGGATDSVAIPLGVPSNLFAVQGVAIDFTPTLFTATNAGLIFVP